MFALVAATGVAMVLNWGSRARGSTGLEWTTKPLATMGMIAITLLIDVESEPQRVAFVVALAFCLVGDIALMLRPKRFIAGLSAFLIGHLVFAVGFLVRADAAPWWSIAVAAIVSGGCMLAARRRLLPSLRRASSRLVRPVSAYMTVIAAMTVTAFVGGSPLAPLGAAVFAVSDSILAENRFVEPHRHAEVAIMATYHTALILLVASLH